MLFIILYISILLNVMAFILTDVGYAVWLYSKKIPFGTTKCIIYFITNKIT